MEMTSYVGRENENPVRFSNFRYPGFFNVEFCRLIPNIK